MKKFVVSLLAILTTMVLFVGVLGCDKKPETNSATALDLVYKDGSLGVVDITVNKDGKVTAIKIDEIFLPSTWAKKTSEGDNASFTNYWTVNDQQTDYARYIRIDNKYFEAKGDNASKPVWEEINGSIKDLEKELKESAQTREWYYNAVKNGKVAIVKAADNGFEDEKDPAKNTHGSMFKSTSSYWPAGLYGKKGWKANIEAIENYVKEYGVNYELGDLEQNPQTELWWIGDVETGATLTEFKDYMKVVKDAYEKAMEIYKKK